MGRGRNKAKQAKVARELKYNAPQTDLEALTRELHSQNRQSSPFDTVDTDFDGDDADQR